MHRKAVLAVAGTLICALLPFAGQGRACAGVLTIDITSPEMNALQTVGGMVRKEYNTATSDQVLVTRTSATAVVAFNGRCTKVDNCLLEIGSDFNCTCCGSHYSKTTGARVSGTATIGLASYPATLSGNIVTVTLPFTKVMPMSSKTSANSFHVFMQNDRVKISNSYVSSPMTISFYNINGRLIHRMFYVQAREITWAFDEGIRGKVFVDIRSNAGSFMTAISITR